MTGRTPYIVRRKYPHMTQEESDVWSRFIQENPGRFDSTDYDFRVGEGVQVNSEWPVTYQNMATALSQKRIDVVAWKNEKPTIVEVKQRVGLSTLGQVLGYQVLFKKDLPAVKVPELLVVCSVLEVDDEKVLSSYGIPVVVVTSG